MEENNPNQPQESDQPRTAPMMDVQPPRQGDPPASPNAPSTNVITPPPAEQPAEEPNPVTKTGAPDPIKRPEITATHKHSAPIVPIILALVIAAILAVVTILAFKNNKAAAPTESAESTNNLTQQEAPVTPESIDTTTAEIDQTLGELDENSDFPEDELSDQNLNL